jgi:hypothetical protein
MPPLLRASIVFVQNLQFVAMPRWGGLFCAFRVEVTPHLRPGYGGPVASHCYGEA